MTGQEREKRMRLQDKVIIITGAGHGLGRAYARRFAEEGAHVIIAEIDAAAGHAVAAEIISANRSAWFRHTDVTQWTSVAGLMEETLARYGRIDVLLNNAAMYETQRVSRGSVEDISEAEWDQVVEVNLKGVFLCCKAVIPIMKQQNSGKILNVSSATVFLGLGNSPHYTATKGGVLALTRVMAKQLGPWNINVNCFTPGSTMTEEVVTDQVRKERLAAAQSRAFPRIQMAEDVTGTALFLASADSDYMTGQCLVVEGGGVLH
jgi:3-oxoacyl-[acyl-carrier protein] reductase